MHLNYDLKKPIPPAQLYKFLLQGDFKQIQCIDEVAQVTQQRQILIALLAQYREQINRRVSLFEKLDKLIEIRSRLKLQLQRLKDQRISIDRNIQFEMQRAKIKPEERFHRNQSIVQIQQLRMKNGALEAKLRQLSQYALKMTRHNQILGKQNIYTASIMTQRTSMSYAEADCCSCKDRVHSIIRNQESVSKQMAEILRIKQIQSQRLARMKQEQIAQRNRRRLSEFENRVRGNY